MYLLRCEHVPRGRPSRRVAYLCRPVTHDEHELLAHILKLSELTQPNRMAKVDIGGAGVEAHLEPQRPPGLQELHEFRLDYYLGDAPLEQAVSCLFVHCHLPLHRGMEDGPSLFYFLAHAHQQPVHGVEL